MGATTFSTAFLVSTYSAAGSAFSMVVVALTATVAAGVAVACLSTTAVAFTEGVAAKVS